MARENKGEYLRKDATVVLSKSSGSQSDSRIDKITGEVAGSDSPGRANSGVVSGDNSGEFRASGGAGTSRWRSAMVEGSRTGKMPHPWFKKWGWWFLPLTFIGAALSAWWGVKHIESQVEAAAPEILRAANVDPSGLSFDADYRNIVVAGNLPPGVSAAQVEQVLVEGTGVDNEDIRYAEVTAQEALPPKPAPAPPLVEPTGEISVAAVSDGQTIRLSGSVPNQEHADKLFSSAAQAVGEDNVVNELDVLGLKPSAANPQVQIDRLARVLPQLGSGISAANLALGDDAFSGSIDAVDLQAKEELDPIVATNSGSEVTVTAPAIAPSQVDVFFDYRDERINLSGEVINQAQRKVLFDASAETVGANNVINTLQLLQADSASHESDSRIAALADTLRDFGGLRSAEGRLSGSDLYMRGVARNDIAKQTIDQTLQSGADADLLVDGKVTLLSIEREMQLLQDLFDSLENEIRENIVFASNSDVLDNRATGVLDKLAAGIANFERPRVDISGHTDSTGSTGKNQDLSARRALAVMTYLTTNGVNGERLRAIGVGESQPIADNNTLAGRQQNRRVEFTAVEGF